MIKSLVFKDAESVTKWNKSLLSNELTRVKLEPKRDYKDKLSNVSPSKEKFGVVCGLCGVQPAIPLLGLTKG